MMAAPIGHPLALPSISSFSGDIIKRELAGLPQHPSSATNMPDLPLTSPNSTYSGPPPPYSYPSSGASSIVGHNNGTQGEQAPGQSAPLQHHQSAREDKNPSYSTARPSLPPLNEALSIKSMLNTHVPQLSSTSARSPTSPTYHNHPDLSHQHSTRNQPSSQQTPRMERLHDMSRQSAATYSPRLKHYDSKPSPQITNSYNSFSNSQVPREPPSPPPFPRPGLSTVQQRPPQSPFYGNGHSSHHAEQSLSAPFGYQQAYQGAYSYPPTAPAVTTYHTPLLDQPWQTRNPDLDRAEEVRKAAPKESPPNKPRYGESVKRQLDLFDVETSLNEIAQGSGKCLDFSRHYGLQNHQSQRTGHLPANLPPLSECDEMIRASTRVMESMTQLRDVIYRQQQALAEQKNYDQQNHKTAMSEPEEDSQSYQDKMEGGGGFAGSDSKKRRGRAAPPGRCHSCNRAETPEWRRGPDGARTLCNACGLHYAKLTRKLSNKNGPGSSNLRPKDSSPVSP